VLPLFTDGSIAYRQISDDNDKLYEYIAINEIQKERLLITNEINVPPPNIGENSLYAYEYSENSVAVGDINRLRARLSDLLLSDGVLQGGDFSKLEIANFLGDQAIEKTIALRCYAALKKQSPMLSQKWLEGAPISIENKNIIGNSVKFEKTKKTKIFRFACKEAITTTINQISSSKGMTKDDYISESLDFVLNKDLVSINSIYSKDKFLKIKESLYTDSSNIFISVFTAENIICRAAHDMMKSETGFSESAILDGLISEEVRKSCLFNNTNPTTLMDDDKNQFIEKIIKKNHTLNNLNRGIFIIITLTFRDLEFFSKVHNNIRLKSERIIKSKEATSRRYFRKFLPYLIDAK
jgi:hypothetical protein